MATSERRDYWDDRGLVWLWTSFLAGPLAFALNIQFGYAAVKWACSHDQRFVPAIIAVAMLTATLSAAWIGWWCLQQVRSRADERGGSRVDRSFFMAVLAVGLNLLIAMVITATVVSGMILSPCE